MCLHAAVLVARAHHGHTERRRRHGGAGKSPARSPRLPSLRCPAGGSYKMAAAARRRAGPGRVSRAAPPRSGQPRSGRHRPHHREGRSAVPERRQHHREGLAVRRRLPTELVNQGLRKSCGSQQRDCQH